MAAGIVAPPTPPPRAFAAHRLCRQRLFPPHLSSTCSAAPPFSPEIPMFLPDPPEFPDAFEKFTNVTTILPLTGKQYSEKVAENCVAYWKKVEKYTDAESAAIEKFLQVMNNDLLFSPLLIDSSIKQLLEAVLESIIGRHGVSPSAKQSLAARISDLLLKPNEPEKVAAATAKPQEN
ncbi:PREDICTED: chalcone--flavonone isomerase-like [Erythranthe guttata]|uniref:chalcone--flavonone isomerase-like n=1 Tax=Erythranthe guttata TaxID=4155 RepID=UPI00064DE0D6|nr:PREDICTED: chalcone--flavonone isomerase-like [Erythranthe guttata]|eukprot:XP_012837806.1 PREDICTED: chalcone--flavonone isomerase-like [Erythranthe guttata]